MRRKPVATVRPYLIGWLLACGWFMLFMTACFVIAAQPAPATTIPLGTTFLTAQNTASVFTVAWSPNGKYLALGGADGTVQVRAAATGDVLFTVHGHANSVWALAWSPDGTHLASASWDNTVRIWNATTGEHL